MLFIHPILQISAIVLSGYVFYLGVQRFRFLHLGHRVPFPWKRHVALGTVTLVALLAGMGIGMTMVFTHWHRILMTGTHARVALTLAPFLVFGLSTGLYMNGRKKRRRIVPLVHGINNLVILGLAISQIFTGWKILNMFVLGL